jgi:hypothetical protein
MDQNRSRAWTLFGAGMLCITIAVMASRPAKVSRIAEDDMRDAVAAPVSPAMLGGARVVRPETGYFASPAGRRAEAEREMLSTRRPKPSKATAARAARLRRERALAVTAQ